MIEDAIFYPVFALSVFTLSFLIVRRKLSQPQWAKKFTLQTIPPNQQNTAAEQNIEEKDQKELVEKVAELVTKKMAFEKMDNEMPKDRINELLQIRDKLMQDLTELRKAKMTKMGIVSEEVKIIDNAIEQIKNFKITETETTPLLQNLDKELNINSKNTANATNQDDDPTKIVRRKAKKKEITDGQK